MGRAPAASPSASTRSSAIRQMGHSLGSWASTSRCIGQTYRAVDRARAPSLLAVATSAKATANAAAVAMMIRKTLMIELDTQTPIRG